MNDINKTLKELNTEDIIWIISIFTAAFAIISNKLEKEYICTNNLKKKKEYKTINITLLSVAFFIYLYFLLLTYSRVKNLTPQTPLKKVNLTHANFIATALFVTGSIISLIVEILSDDDTDIDLQA